MLVITGDETGLLKTVDVSNNNAVKVYGEQSRKCAIKSMDWISSNTFATARDNGAVEIWKVESDRVILFQEHQSALANIVALRRLPSKCNNSEAFVLCDTIGKLSVEKINDTFERSAHLFDVAAPVSACVTCLEGGVALGGRENDIHMYNSTTNQEVWKAKNVPHDKLSLRVPVWITALAFLRPESDTCSAAHLVSGTGYKHVRIYDTAASRQPVVSIDIGGDFRVTAIRPTSDGNGVFVADTAGGLHQWDLRTQRRIYTLKGSTGSIRDVQTNRDGSHLAAVGLDRYMRLYDARSNKPLSSTYMKNRLNCCLVGEGEFRGKTAATQRNGEEQEGFTGRSGVGRAVSNERDEDLLEEYSDSDDDDEEQEGEDVSGSSEDDGDDDVSDESSDDEESPVPSRPVGKRVWTQSKAAASDAKAAKASRR